jgi:hypothetical protein
VNNAPFDIASDWGKWALGYGALWFLLIFAVEAGAGEPAAALAVLIAGGATVYAIDTVIKDLGFAPLAKGG